MPQSLALIRNIFLTLPSWPRREAIARAIAHEHVLSSFAMLEAILEQVGGSWPQPKRETAKVSS